MDKRGHNMYHCDEREFQLNFSGWPTNIINIEIPSIRGKFLTLMQILWLRCCYYAHMYSLLLILAGFGAYPSVTEIAEANLSSIECGLPTQLSFSAREISDGTFFKAIEDYDPDIKRILHQLKTWVVCL